MKKQFDKNGRRIPDGLQVNVCNPNPKFHFDQPTFNLKELAESFKQYFPKGLIFPSANEMQDKGMAVIEWIKNQEQLKNILNGPHFILGFPKMKVNDYGEVLEEVFLKAVESAYKTKFPKRTFKNYRKGELKGKVSVVKESRNQLHILMPKQRQVIVWFPGCLQGWSINAQREEMSTLPNSEKIWLSGAFEASAGIAGYPEAIVRDYNTPGMDLSALSWQSVRCSLDFLAVGAMLYFGSTDYLASAYDYYSGGLCFGG